MKLADVIFMIFMAIMIFAVGMIVSKVYDPIEYVKEAYWQRNATNEWVCVDITDLEFERAVELCQHEVGHEIFAEICEKDIEKCFNLST